MFTDQFLQSLIGFSDRFSEQFYWQGEDVFVASELSNIKQIYERYRNHLRPAKIGKGIVKRQSDEIRNDLITWIDNENKEFLFLWNLISIFKEKAKAELFLPLKRNESQMALYQEGRFYLKHVDQHKMSPSRVLTLVFYLNDWVEGDGGELVLYKENNEEIIVKPRINNMIIFASQLEHEVLITNKERKSITSWYRDDVI